LGSCDGRGWGYQKGKVPFIKVSWEMRRKPRGGDTKKTDSRAQRRIPLLNNCQFNLRSSKKKKYHKCRVATDARRKGTDMDASPRSLEITIVQQNTVRDVW